MPLSEVGACTSCFAPVLLYLIRIANLAPLCNAMLFRDLIKAYRACTTRSEERALVKKEAAHIRDLFREGDKTYRRQNISKLLFFHMNGYPTDFGMTECIKLCASNKYNDKRVAYLGLMILVDETEEILMLMTNCLKQDLNSAELQIVSLALNVLGDIASVEMVRDLLPEIEKHLLSDNAYIRKKAALAAVRAVRKLGPEETFNVLRGVPAVFNTKVPSVHISGAALISALCTQAAENISELQEAMTPILLNVLRDHLLGKNGRGPGSLSETFVGGVRNPFLQVKLITAIRSLTSSRLPTHLAESISDILAQVAANTDSAKVAGCAVLYECVKTITVLDTDKSLKELAVNILGKFLSHKESTVRYIALQELTEVVDADGPQVLASIEGHKERIVAGLREADPTIRKRAIELAYRVANESNIEEMMRELLQYIEKNTTADSKEDGCWKVFLLLERFGPSDEWKIETFVSALSSADMAMPEELITSFIALVSSRPSAQPHAVRTLFLEALEQKSSPVEIQSQSDDPFGSGHQTATDASQTTGGSDPIPKQRKPRLERVALYILGEYGEEAPAVGLGTPQVIDAFERALRASEAVDEAWVNTYDPAFLAENKVLREVALTGLVKFAARALGSDGSRKYGTITDPLLALTEGPADSQSSRQSSILALTAPPNEESKVLDHGLGTDLLASMGLEDQDSKPSRTEQSSTLSQTSNALVQMSQGDAAALMSLGTDEGDRSGNPVIDRVRRILLLRARSTNVEIQQRACEYLMLLNESLLPTLSVAMAAMPPLDFRSIQERARRRKELRISKAFSNGTNGDGLLLDLMGEEADAPQALPAAGGDLLALPASAPSGKDLTLDDLMGGSSSTATAAAAGPSGHSSLTDLANLGLGNKSNSPRETVPVANLATESGAALHSSTVFESEALQAVAVFFQDESGEKGNTRADLVFTNKLRSSMSNFVFLVAVPKYIKLQMHPASDTHIPEGGRATQSINLINSLHGQKPVQLRYRVEYCDDRSGEVSQHQGVVGGLEAL